MLTWLSRSLIVSSYVVVSKVSYARVGPRVTYFTRARTRTGRVLEA